MNPEAIPFLVRQLEHRHSVFSRLCEWVYHRLPLPRAWRTRAIQPVPEDRMRRNAFNLLRLTRYNAEASLPVLIKEYEKADGARRVALASALAEMDAPAMPALPVLRASLASADRRERAAAQAAIDRIKRASERPTHWTVRPPALLVKAARVRALSVGCLWALRAELLHLGELLRRNINTPEEIGRALSEPTRRSTRGPQTGRRRRPGAGAAVRRPAPQPALPSVLSIGAGVPSRF